MYAQITRNRQSADVRPNPQNTASHGAVATPLDLPRLTGGAVRPFSSLLLKPNVTIKLPLPYLGTPSQHLLP
jgi:hypothetical protein